MSTENKTPTPDGSLVTVLYGLIIYHNCFREMEYISWWYLLWIALLYFALSVPFAIAAEVISAWRERR